MYKVKHRLCPNSICNIFNEHTSAYNLRQSDFSTPRYNTVTYGKHSALCRTQIQGETVYDWHISQDTAGFYKLYSQKGYNSLNGHGL